MKPLDRILLFITALLASYQVVQGIDGLTSMAIACYTISFGVIVIASLLLIILGFEVLDSSLVVVVSSLIPLSLALGLFTQFLRPSTIAYGIFTVLGFVAILITRLVGRRKLAVVVLAFVHGVAGLMIFFLPITMATRNITPLGFVFVSLGGTLIGLGGLLLSFLKTGKPVFSREKILQIFPALLTLMTIAFVTGFAFV